jgi:hypothetical protein
MPDTTRRLLDHLIRTRLLPVEQRQAELVATSETDDTLPATTQRLLELEQTSANELADAFTAGLARAAAQRDRPLTLDDHQPEENQIADALIRFLVRANLAEVTSETLAPDHYRYSLTVDWSALDAVAHEADTSLDELLGARD